ncbi:SidA/IucD/PvdA family monooxygenase [Streptomyces sp. N2-109]|uniref:L-lysine N6-monooxygenase MbtG n=1 Tax=Streptomyces gossypii TaxID=2883101 RepID=A0ABT2K2M1_9ACTN|nr:SidA/IucD/PvdA family monooxygenase [Streptomyces gossypii]MCT2594398.1 SidA/IucD/PvdA family monooxygenase [Streptomyces gossypii]
MTSAAAAPSPRPAHSAAAHVHSADSAVPRARPLDLAGIGIGPCNLSLAALAHGVPGLRTAFFEQQPEFSWHPGLLIEGATLQVPFLADLVSLADPASPWSFLRYLRARERLFPFYFAERFHITRAEYEAYCRWVCTELESRPTRSGAPGDPADRTGGTSGAAGTAGGGGVGLYFGHRIDALRWNTERAVFELDFTRLHAGSGTVQARGRAYARNLCLGVGTAPHVPEPLRPLLEAPTVPVLHSADYLAHRARLLAAGHVTVVGSGQSGAEVFLDLLRRRPAGAEGLHWVTRSPAFAPMEYSKLGLEHFTPDYARYFHGLPEQVRDGLLTRQGQLHKAIDHGTLGAIHDELYQRTLSGGWPDAVLTPGVGVRTAGRIGRAQVELHLEHAEQGARSRLVTDAVVLATGYRERSCEGLLSALDPHIRRDARRRPRIDEEFRIVLDPSVRGAVHVQNAERHTHGVGAPDLGLAAYRSARILNAVTGGEQFPLPRRSAFTTFGLRDEGTGRQEEGARQESTGRGEGGGVPYPR